MKLSKKAKKRLLSLALVLVLIIVAGAFFSEDAPPAAEPQYNSPAALPDAEPQPSPEHSAEPQPSPGGMDETIPEYSGEAFCVINDNLPAFTVEDHSTEAYEYFAELDYLGRCGVTMACLGRELMPTGDRESISHVYPSGWVNVPYSFVDGEYLYNRCHLIGFQLSGENANVRNLITGTRYMNTEGMLPFENMVADYIKETGNHVLYRVTPIFEGTELVARGVQMEAWSVEDGGDGICFNVYCYNVQPGVKIDYASGESELNEESFISGKQGSYVLNANSKKFHYPHCSSVTEMSEKNRREYTGSRELLIDQGYEPCSRCNP